MAARLAWYSQHGGEFSQAFPTQEIEHIIEPAVSNYPRYQHQQRLLISFILL